VQLVLKTYDHSTSTLQTDEEWTENTSTAITYSAMQSVAKMCTYYAIYTYAFCFYKYTGQNSAVNTNTCKQS